jgi:hypothetical protein
MKITLTASIAAPIDVAFAAAGDIAHWPQFISGIERVEMLTPGPLAAGARFRETRVMFGRRAAEEMSVAEIAPPRLLVLTASNHGTFYRVTHLFEAAPAGSRLTLSFEGRPVTLLARLLAPLGLLMRGAVERQLAADLADLAREAERRHRGAAPGRG